MLNCSRDAISADRYDALMSKSLQSFLSSTLGPLPLQALAAVSLSQEIRVHKGDALLRAGALWSTLMWVQSGVLRMYYLDRHGHAANKNFYLEGALLWPLTPALSSQPADFWIEAIAPVHIWSLPWATWQTACAQWTAWQDPGTSHTGRLAGRQDAARAAVFAVLGHAAL